ncbi:hypothetical protein EMPS_02823 [Entomortierella parvispora]|uniref:Protein FAM72 n=1 Tax=Entomortierella parvispora TaxID=205924 RepID=A0A9P3H5N8_9FUNG|nr:hypothetical protein EMPS_02823 [Entomortierella parvispora]
MPHSIRDFYLHRNPNNYAPSYSVGPATSTSTGIPRGYSSSFNTSYNFNPADLPSYSYTNRFLQRTSVAPASTSTATSSTNSSTAANSGPPRMPQYPPPQHQHYANVTASTGTTTNIPGTGYTGYSSTYQGGGNSDRYNASYSSYSSVNGAGSGTGGHTQSKIVCRMDCRHCSAVVCLRGMKAMLLADTKVELYSTDHPPGSVQLIDKDYTTSNCKCRIRDVACKVCGNVIGYHITQPCQQCLKAPNNGHFWMFHTDGVVGQERLSMDLKKLVEELVRGPVNPTPPEPTMTPPMISGTLAPGVAPDAATTRLTSVSRLQRLQRQQQRQTDSVEAMLSSRVLTTSPAPATPTPSSSSSVINMPMGRHITSSPSPESADDEQQGDEQGFESRHGLGRYAASSTSKAASVLATLTLSQFLQPMKWENLPNPDLDIDLDPNIMGGEPLFADQWTDLVLRYAEAAAVNLSLALDQEEETNRFMDEVMQEQEERRKLLTKRDGQSVGGNDKYEVDEDENVDDDDVDEVIELIPEMGEDSAFLTTTIIELDGAQSEEPTTSSSRREIITERNGAMDLEILIDRVDDIVLNSQSGTTTTVITMPADDKEEDLTMDIDALHPSSQRGRTLGQHQQESDPGSVASTSATAAAQIREHTNNQQPGQQRTGRRDRDRAHARSASFGSHLRLGDQNPNTDRTRARSNSIGSLIRLGRSIDLSAVSLEGTNPIVGSEEEMSPPAFALTAAMMAHAAAKAAATDADAASSNLLYGRRTRRDYDSMCR